MKVLHIVPEFNEANGVFVVARMLAGEGGGRVVDAHAGSRADVDAVDEVWVHGMWLPCEWRACRLALKAGKRLVRMTHGSLSPVYLERQGKWKKRLVAPIERHYFAKCDRVVVTGGWEEEWCRKWGVKGPFETVDLKRFFSLKFEVQSSKLDCRGGGLSDCQIDGLSDCCSRAGSSTGQSDNQTISQSDNGAGQSNTQTLKHSNNEPLHLLYLGRRHSLKGVEYLEAAVRSLKLEAPSIPRNRSDLFLGKTDSACSTCSARLKIISSAFGAEKEKIWSWCDVLVLPTLSDNFGLVVAEALERGKRVITTDGAPAWEENLSRVEHVERVDGGEILTGYDGRLLYLKGYRDGTPEQRVRLLKEAIGRLN